MKKPFMFILCVLLVFSLVSCASAPPEDSGSGKPPAFSILQKQTTLTKHSEKGESTSFSQDDFKNLVGESLTYITVTTLPESNLGTLIFNGTAVAEGQTLPAGSLEYLKFLPSIEAATASFTFTCDSAGFDGKELNCNIIFTEGVNSPPVALDSNLKTVAGISCEGNLAINEPNGDSFTVNVITYPRDGYITVDSNGSVIYTPEEGFSGSDSMVYTVTDRFGAVSAQATLKIQVAENESGIHFADMEDNMMHLYAHRMCEDNVMVYRYDNGEYFFDPEAPVTKLEFLVMLMNVSGLDTDIVAVADSVVSDDTGLSSGLKGYLSAAAEKGLILLDNGNFLPKDVITVADAAYMITASLKLPKANSDNASSDATEDTFSAMLAASNAGLFEVLEPEKTLTKAEAAELLCKVEDYMLANNMKS